VLKAVVATMAVFAIAAEHALHASNPPIAVPPGPRQAHEANPPSKPAKVNPAGARQAHVATDAAAVAHAAVLPGVHEPFFIFIPKSPGLNLTSSMLMSHCFVFGKAFFDFFEVLKDFTTLLNMIVFCFFFI